MTFIRKDGTATVKIMQPGRGSSGYYPADVLERDGPSVFKKNTPCFWNHATAQEAIDRPERALQDYAGVFVSDARYEESNAAGPGLYADIKVMAHYRPFVEELGSHTGLSISALGHAKPGEIDGWRGPIIEKIVAAKSVDFVTAPGAGGKVLQLFESARGGRSTHTPSREEPQMDEKDITALKEANEASSKRIKELEEAAERDRQAAAVVAEKLLLREATEIARVALAKTTLPTITQARLVEQLARTAPMKEGKLDAEAYATALDEAAKAMVAEFAAVTGSGRIQGMGGGPPATLEPEKAAERKQAAFQRLGLSESTAKIAAAGRN